jgi:hypothetical protein
METSAKNAVNVEQAFLKLGADIKRRLGGDKEEPKPADNKISIGKSEPAKKKKLKCMIL